MGNGHRRVGVFCGSMAVVALAHGALGESVVKGQRTDAPAITLDFVASDRSGEPLLGLTPGDVTLKVAGRERRILALDIVSRPSIKDDTTGTPRNIVLVVDEPTLFGLEPVVKEAVARLLASLSRRDLVAYSSTRRGGTTTNITYRHELITKAVESMVTGPGELWTCARDLLLSVERLVGQVPPGRSTTVAVISRGSATDASYRGDTEGGPCQLRRNELRSAEETISAAQINFNLFTAEHLNRSWAFDTIARNTGGGSNLLTWKDAGALERAIASTSQYYRLTFVGDASAPRRPERVDLRINRPDVKVQTSPTVRLAPGP